MTKPGDSTPSNFDARADNAALALRQTLLRQGRELPERAPVQVDANGKPPAPLPPEGSYARQAIEQRRRQQQVALPPADQRAEDGLHEEPPPADPQDQVDPAASPRADKRIQELVAQLRAKDQELQQAMEMGRRATETAQQYEQRLNAIEQQHQQLLQRNLDQLDPETRQKVLLDAQIAQATDNIEQRILGRLQPKLQSLESTAKQQELHALAQKYPGFDYQIHSKLIDQFRAANPRCSIEQAFRAVAEPEELGVRQAARATAIPPIVPPGNGDLGSARYVPSQVTNPKPRQEDELAEESRRIAELRRSTDPAQQKLGMQMLEQHLRKRIAR